MKTYELMDEIEIQSDVRFCYYDYEKNERIFLGKRTAEQYEIKYMYIEMEKKQGRYFPVIYIEVDHDI